MSSKLSLVPIAIALLLSVTTFQAYASETASLAKMAMERAQNNLIDAYERILNAEKAGADVASLTEKLTSAGADLTKAYTFYDSGDYDAAKGLADNCYVVGEGIKAEAGVLEGTASTRGVLVFWFQVYGWVGTVALIVLSSVWVWQAFKKQYHRKILEMKPEAIVNES